MANTRRKGELKMENVIFIKSSDLIAKLNEHFCENEVVDSFIEDYLGDAPDFLDKEGVIEDIKCTIYKGEKTMEYIADHIIPELPTYKIVRAEE